MATMTIERIQRKSGIKYKARVRANHHNKRVFEKSKTFSHKSKAMAWAKQTIKELGNNGIPSIDIPTKGICIGKLITLYLNDSITSRDIGRTKACVLRKLLNYDIALVSSEQLTATHLVKHCRERLQESTSPLPQTVYQDITYLRSVINVAGPIFGYKANIHAHNEAIPTLVQYNLIGRSNQRYRRPTKEELVLAEEGLKLRQNHQASFIPLVDIFRISILTCMRLGEITRITWDDLNIEEKTLTIRDRKDPRRKKGNNSTIPLFAEALEILKRQPTLDKYIFPYKTTSISSAWQRMCKKQGIKDLHYHDLRAEGACQLFEKGLNVVQISKITGHRDINVLNNIYLRVDITKLNISDLLEI